MDTKTNAKPKPATPDRRQRLAEVLRENLKKRKALARARAGSGATDEPALDRET